MRILGIDEAGRGCLIGPLVMTGVIVEDDAQLKELGVKDSKDLSVKKREALAKDIPGLILDSKTIYVSAEQINDYMSSGVNLNMIEAKTTAKIINALKPDLAILDCPSINITGYVNSIKNMLTCECEIKAEFKADVHFPVVSAASILAKVGRDNAVAELSKKYDIDIGSGYMNDAKTVSVLDKYYSKYPIFRTHWEPYKRKVNEHSQKTLM